MGRNYLFNGFISVQVFCTKSKPNCNACPMRGECRHFASAFTRLFMKLCLQHLMADTAEQVNKLKGKVICMILVNMHRWNPFLKTK